MVKTTVYLPEQTRRRLRTAALLEGVAEAEIIRQAVEARVSKVGHGFRLTEFPIRSAQLDAAKVDEMLSEGFGE